MTLANPQAIIRKDANDLNGWLATEQGFLHAFAKLNDQRITWEKFQLAFLGCRSRFRAMEKSRQVGGSMVMAAESLARAMLRHTYTGTFLSFNREDAEDKIEYARSFYEALPMSYQKKIIRETKQILEFEEHGGQKRRTRIMSHPSKPVRSKRGDVYMDELAHYAKDALIYRGSTAPIARVPSAQVTVCSSPLGNRGVFWQICRPTPGKFTRFARQAVPWWICKVYCKDIKSACVLAPHMSTEDRVEKFGREPLVEQFDSLPLEDFQEEFECKFGDDSASYFGVDLVIKCTDSDLEITDDIGSLPGVCGDGALVAGFDIGRHGHPSELVIIEDVNGVDTIRCLMQFRNWEFDKQEAFLIKMLRRTPDLVRLSIDETGLGMHLAENVCKRYPDRAEGCTFNNKSKAQWCADIKIKMQRDELAIPADKALIGQLRSIRKTHLQSGALAFNSKKVSAKTHADRFWALALACKTKKRRARRPVAAEVLVLG